MTEKVTICTQEQVDKGDVPPHQSCLKVERDGKTEYHYSGHTGSKTAKPTAKKSE